MVISCSTCQREEKEGLWVKYLIYAVLPQFKFCCNLRTFSAKFLFPDFQSSQKNVYSKSGGVSLSLCCIFYKLFSLTAQLNLLHVWKKFPLLLSACRSRNRTLEWTRSTLTEEVLSHSCKIFINSHDLCLYLVSSHSFDGITEATLKKCTLSYDKMYHPGCKL